VLDHIGEPGKAPAAASDVVLIFTRKGTAYDSVLSLVKGWTVAGLVKESIWIDAATPTLGWLLNKEGLGPSWWPKSSPLETYGNCAPCRSS